MPLTTAQSKKVLFIPTETSEDEPSKKIPQHFYGCFSFKDRLTNSSYTYNQSFKSSNLSFQEWTPYDQAHYHLKHLINTYKFTKKFQINCLRERNRFIRYPLNKSSSLEAKPPHQVGKRQINNAKQRFSRKKKEANVLGEEWSQDQEHQSRRNNGRTGKEKDLYQRSINHMHCEVNINNQCLLELPSTLKKKTLLKEMINQNKKRHKSTVKPRDPPSLYARNQISTLSFAPLSNCAPERPFSQQVQNNQFLELVKAGYVNEACHMAANNPDLCEFTDEKGENALHLSVREGNCRMLQALFKFLPWTTSCLLLRGCNKNGRTALQKAEMLGEQEIVSCLKQKMKSMKIR